MQTVNEALDALRDAAMAESAAEARQYLLADIVAGLADIDWGPDDQDKWMVKLDVVVDLLAEKLGGHGKLSYAILYLLERLAARGFIAVTATNWNDNNWTNGSLRLETDNDACEGRTIEFNGKDSQLDVSVRLEATELGND